MPDVPSGMAEAVESPWGMDELHVFDPSGSLVKFGQLTTGSSRRMTYKKRLRSKLACTYARQSPCSERVSDARPGTD